MTCNIQHLSPPLRVFGHFTHCPQQPNAKDHLKSFLILWKRKLKLRENELISQKQYGKQGHSWGLNWVPNLLPCGLPYMKTTHTLSNQVKKTNACGWAGPFPMESTLLFIPSESTPSVLRDDRGL